MRAALPGIALLWAGCAEAPPVEPPPPVHPCASAEVALEVAPPDGDYGELQDGDDLWCGNPPQGGAPYTPFRMRLHGPDALADGVVIEMVALDPEDGTELGRIDVALGLTCANVGDSAGWWVAGGEAHLRYYGFLLEELDGVEAEIAVRASSVDGTVEVEDSWLVGLTLQ